MLAAVLQRPAVVDARQVEALAPAGFTGEAPVAISSLS